MKPRSKPSNGGVQKRQAQPKRSIEQPGDNHPLGLWIDKDLLRKHRDHMAQTVIHNPLPNTNQRYLELADLALGVNKSGGKSKKKSKSAAAE